MAERDAFDKALDLMIDEAVKIAGENGESEPERVTEREFSEEHEKKMKRVFRKWKIENRKKVVVRYSKMVASVCVVALFLTGISFFGVKAWRKNFVNFFYDEDAPNSKYNFSDLGGTTYENDKIRLSYIPWGFELVRNDASEHIMIMLFKKEDLYFTVSAVATGIEGSIDTEEATVGQIDVGDCTAVLVEKDGVNQILWQDGDDELNVSGNINSDEIIKIARNLKIF